MNRRGAVRREFKISHAVNAALAALNKKFPGGFEFEVKFSVRDEGSVMLGPSGVRGEDGDAVCTLSADADTFAEILSGKLDPTSAYMSGRLRIYGDMGVAMQLGRMI